MNFASSLSTTPTPTHARSMLAPQLISLPPTTTTTTSSSTPSTRNAVLEEGEERDGDCEVDDDVL